MSSDAIRRLHNCALFVRQLCLRPSSEFAFPPWRACFFAFDVLWNRKEYRRDALTDRKLELRRLLAKTFPPFPIRYADHIDGSGTKLFQRVCDMDLEGIVAKQKNAPYVAEREQSTWFKIRNPNYSQIVVGREELFERE